MSAHVRVVRGRPIAAGVLAAAVILWTGAGLAGPATVLAAEQPSPVSEATPTPEPTPTPSPDPTETPDPPGEPAFVTQGIAAQYRGYGSSRLSGAPADPAKVRWVFSVSGLPEGEEFAFGALFSDAGEVTDVGTTFVVVETMGHDTLEDAWIDYHVADISNPPAVAFRLETVTFEVAQVAPAPAPAPSPAPTAPNRGSSASTQRSSSANASTGASASSAGTDPATGEPFLPFTGANDFLLGYAAASALLGALLRRAASSEERI